MNSHGTYQQTRALCNELSRGLGSAALFTVVAFCIYSSVTGYIKLGWLWIPWFLVSTLVATLAVGLPVLLFRMGMEFKRPTIGSGWFLALKVVAAVWFFGSFVVAWRVAEFTADLMK